MEHLTKKQYLTSGWSGGKTVEIAIAPAGARYSARDFLWRLSSATVELEESDFSQLENYSRWIAPLRGTLRLSHNGGEPVELDAYEVYRFDGADATHAWGRCTDFNLMLRKGRCGGRIDALRGKTGDARSISPGASELIVYCAVGSAEVEANGTRVPLAASDALRFSPREANRVTVRFTEDGCVMAAQMRKIN